MSEIRNKIKESRLETVDLEEFTKGETVQELDIRFFLFKEMILREKDFREQIENHDWSQYEGVCLAVHCSTDAIIPSWAWMIVAAHAKPYAKDIVFGSGEDAWMALLKEKMDAFNWDIYKDKYILLKGCSKVQVPAGAYLEATKKLIPIAGKLMYGEACSNVPVYRKPRKQKSAS